MKRITLYIVLIMLLVSAMPGMGQKKQSIPAKTNLAADAVKSLPANAFSGFPAGVFKTIEFEIEEAGLERMTYRQKSEQARDQLFLAVLNDSKLPASIINQITFDIPVSRRNFFKPIANFEYGETRSRFIGDGKALALIPECGEAERLDYLAHIVDEERKNLGSIPDTLLVFEYKLGDDLQRAEVKKLSDTKTADLFTEQAGYYEADIDGLPALEKFMEQIDDITFASRAGDRLRLGGRKLKSRSYGRATIDDVAAIWQSEREIAKNQTAFDQQWKPKLMKLSQARTGIGRFMMNLSKLNLTAAAKENEKLQSMARSTYFTTWKDGAPQKVYLISPEIQSDLNELYRVFYTLLYSSSADASDLNTIPTLMAQLQRSYETHERRVKAILKASGVVAAPESGFSLDPTYDYAKLKTFFDDEFAPSLRELASVTPKTVSNDDINRISDSLGDNDEGPLLNLMEKLANAMKDFDDQSVQIALDSINQTYSYQRARYDGKLQGTSVGMTLFYTDLIAKLWALDFAGTAPSEIPGFISMPDLKLSPVHKKEVSMLSNTRLWFGHRDSGFQIAENGEKLAFARVATRLFSKSATSFSPDAEVESNMESALFIDWWDNHFEEVAAYEPQYERLNEIMKWSLVIGWLNEAGKGDSLSFLEQVEVKSQGTFPEWATSRNDLKFNNWEKISFYPAGYLSNNTESLPLLESKEYDNGQVLSGGVSLAGKTVFKARTAIAQRINSLLRRPNINYTTTTTKAGSQVIKTIDGAGYNLTALPKGGGRTLSIPKKDVRLRDASGEIAQNFSIDRQATRTTEGMVFETKVGGVSNGSLAVKTDGTGFKVNWKARDLDEGHSIARNLSTFSAPSDAEDFLKLHPGIEKAYSSKAGEYSIKMRGSNKWLKIKPEVEGTIGVPKGIHSRVSDKINGMRSYDLAWSDKAPLPNEVSRLKKVVDQTPGAAKAVTPQNLAKIDNLLAKNEPVTALRYLDELGSVLPEVKLRRALALSKRGLNEKAREAIDGIPAAGEARNRLFAEINGRQRAAGEGMEFIPDGDNIAVSCNLKGQAGIPVDLNDIPEGRRIYVEDASDFNNINWILGVKPTLRNNPFIAELGEAVKLPRGSIGDYSPVEIYMNGGGIGGGTRFKSVASEPQEGGAGVRWIFGVPLSRHITPLPCADDDEDKVNDDDDGCDIYVIRKKDASQPRQ